MNSRDLALRLRRDFGGFTGGVFLGYGDHNDHGDSDEAMYYTFGGIKAEHAMSFGSVFGEVGYFDFNDEYDEGTRPAPYLRGGMIYNLPNAFVLTGSFGCAGGKKYTTDSFTNHIVNVEIGIERRWPTGCRAMVAMITTASGTTMRRIKMAIRSGRCMSASR